MKKEKDGKNKKKAKKINRKKILIITLSVLLCLTVAGAITYKKVIEPIFNQKLDVVISKLESVSQNEDAQRKIDSVVDSMIEDGKITEESIPQYMKLKEENEARWDEARIVENIEKINKEGSEGENKKENSVGKGASQDNEASQTTVAQKNTSPAPTETVQQNQSAETTGGDLRSRMKAAMTASEFAFATYMYGKIDLGYAQSLYYSDKAAAKEYIYSRVTSSEISRALEIYAKYAYLVG